MIFVAKIAKLGVILGVLNVGVANLVVWIVVVIDEKVDPVLWQMVLSS